tara:strand:+ start:6264 stop:7097 length:834 start_codon:yes stop_codon:yes gene_type:complete
MKYHAIDADSIVHIVANVHWSAGNRDNEKSVRTQTRHFVQNVIGVFELPYLVIFQDVGHQNFRKDILPSYKSHRAPNEGVAHWKPIIIDEMKKFNHLALKQIETDDACAILGKLYGWDVLISTADKDLNQIPGHKYNPFKSAKHIADEDRLFKVGTEEANDLLWQQVLTSDGTDCSLEETGIIKVGPKTAEKYLKPVPKELYLALCAMKYTEKYGVSEGLRRMAVTYDMMKMLNEVTDKYPETYIAADSVFKKFQNSTMLFDTPEPVENTRGNLFNQ